ncbi:hypothetical protein RBWH47_05573 [Rhodopirellula baltica WH47]|uniref:Uncharacterized protein n=1 Tax=Rhodopirellula baltica WH47 TaxID=991778 RepID=F2AM14_RHOBT|nr:hypothetical protein RBWH47_05573 [Rhodopirellula baltica WH47]
MPELDIVLPTSCFRCLTPRLVGRATANAFSNEVSGSGAMLA